MSQGNEQPERQATSIETAYHVEPPDLAWPSVGLFDVLRALPFGSWGQVDEADSIVHARAYAERLVELGFAAGNGATGFQRSAMGHQTVCDAEMHLRIAPGEPLRRSVREALDGGLWVVDIPIAMYVLNPSEADAWKAGHRPATPSYRGTLHRMWVSASSSSLMGMADGCDAMRKFARSLYRSVAEQGEFFGTDRLGLSVAIVQEASGRRRRDNSARAMPASQ